MVRSSFSALFLLLLAGSASAQNRGDGGGTPAPQTDRHIATVNGQKIPADWYIDLLNDHAMAQRQQGQPENIAQVTDDEYFSTLIDEELVRQEAEKRGVVVTRDEAIRVMIESPPDFIRSTFTNAEGVYQKEQFRKVAMNPQKITEFAQPGQNRQQMVENWKRDLEKVIRYVQNSRTRELLVDAIYKEQPLTESQIKNRYFASKTLLNGSFVRVYHSTIPDSAVSLTEAEARAWYESHKPELTFAAVRSIGTMILPVAPLAADTVVRRKRVDSVLQAIRTVAVSRRSAVVRAIAAGLPPGRYPDKAISLAQIPPEFADTVARSSAGSLLGPFERDGEIVMLFIEGVEPQRDTVVKARHILFRANSGTDTTGTSEVMELMLKLKEKITEDTVFAQAAQIYSQDGSAKIGGNLGWFGRGKMIHEFDSVSFLTKPGSVVGPVRTSFGYHLLRVSERSNKGYRIRELRFPLPISPEAVQSVLADARRYADALRSGSGVDSLQLELKSRYRGTVTDTSTIERMQKYGDVLAVGEFAFNAAVGDVHLFTLPFDRVAVVKVLDVREAGLPPFEKFPRYVTAFAKLDKKMEMLKPRVEQLKDSLKWNMLIGPMRQIAPMAEIFLVQDKTVDAPPDEDPTILDSLIATVQGGGVTGPVRGKWGYYFVRAEYKSGPSGADYRRDGPQFAEQYRQEYQQQRAMEILKRARAMANVVDLRPSMQMVLQQQP